MLAGMPFFLLLGVLICIVTLLSALSCGCDSTFIDIMKRERAEDILHCPFHHFIVSYMIVRLRQYRKEITKASKPNVPSISLSPLSS